MNLSSTDIASQPLTAEAITPAIRGAFKPSFKACRPSKTTAAVMIGRLRRKLKTAADSRESPSARPAVIVLPERETPGTMANICARPMKIGRASCRERVYNAEVELVLEQGR